MQIKVYKAMDLRLPTALALNGLTAMVFAPKLRAQGCDISAVQLSAFFRAIRRYRRAHPEWDLVEVLSDDREMVRIRL